jgi:hypothetical protein
MSWSIRSWLTNRWRSKFRLGGAFRYEQSSARSRALNELWGEKWHGFMPYLLHGRPELEHRWVRFHSLPGGKQFAEDDDESAEILKRHTSLLTELTAHSRTDSITVIAVDFSAYDSGGWTEEVIPDAWPWTTFINQVGAAPSAEDDIVCYFWVAGANRVEHLDSLLTAAADGIGSFVVVPPSLDWIYAPFDGGADVYLPDARTRDWLEYKYRLWAAQ